MAEDVSNTLCERFPPPASNQECYIEDHWWSMAEKHDKHSCSELEGVTLITGKMKTCQGTI